MTDTVTDVVTHQPQPTPPPHINRMAEYATMVMQTGDAQKCLSGLKSLRILLEYSEPPIQEVFDSGVVPHMVQLLSQGDAQPVEIQIELVECLHFLSFGTRAQSEALVTLNVLPLMVPHLRNCQYPNIQQAALMLFGNIASENAALRDAVLAEGVLQTVLSVLENNNQLLTTEPFITDASWLLQIFCTSHPRPAWAIISLALPVLVQVLKNSEANPNSVFRAVTALKILTEDSSNDQHQIQTVQQLGVAPRLVELMQHKVQKIRACAVDTLANMASGTSQQIEVVLQAGVLVDDVLLNLLMSGSPAIQQSIGQMLCNLAAESIDVNAKILAAKFVPVAVALLQQTPGDETVQKEMCWLLANVLGLGTDAQVGHVMNHGALSAILTILPDQDFDVQFAVLRSINRVLQFGAVHQQRRGLSTNPYAEIICADHGEVVLKDLQRATEDREDLYDLIQEILTTYFDSRETVESAALNESLEGLQLDKIPNQSASILVSPSQMAHEPLEDIPELQDIHLRTPLEIHLHKSLQALHARFKSMIQQQQ